MSLDRIVTEMRRTGLAPSMRTATHFAAELATVVAGLDPAAAAAHLNLVRIGGVNYPMWGAASKALGVTHGALQKHVARHGTEEPYWNKRYQPVRVGGVNYPSWTAAGRALGVVYQAAQRHVEKHGTEEPYWNKNFQPVRVGGVNYPSWTAAGRVLRVSYTALQLHVEQYGTEVAYFNKHNVSAPKRIGKLFEKIAMEART